MGYNVFNWDDLGFDPTTGIPPTKSQLADWTGWEEDYVDDIPWMTEGGAKPTGRMGQEQALKEFEVKAWDESKMVHPQGGRFGTPKLPVNINYPKQLRQRSSNNYRTPSLKENLPDVETIGIDDEMFDPLDSFTEGKKREREPKEEKDGVSAFGKGSLTTGDKIGMISGAAGTLLNAGLTIANRLGDSKNTNSFITYAQDAIRTMDESKRYAQNMFDYALQDIDFNEGSARRTITQNARGINQQRALQLGLHMQGQDARRKARVDYAGSMLGINRDISRLQERHDQMYMSAEERRLDKDKADRDAFFTNLSSNVTDATLLGQQIGKNLNQSLETQQKLKLLNQYGKYSYFDDEFNLVGRPLGTTPPATNTPASNPVAKAAPTSSAYAPHLFDYEIDDQDLTLSNGALTGGLEYPTTARLGMRWNPVTKKLEPR